VAVERWPGGIRREVVRHPGACAAVAFVDDHRILLVRQMREAVRRELLEVPAGTRDVAGESGEDTMGREIREETGYEAKSLELIGSILTTPGFTNERIDLYVARVGPEPVGEPEEEGVEVVIMDFDEAVAAAVSGGIEDAKSVVALLLARIRRRERSA
jgi:ADP-ribose pyrophosphatase